MTSRILRLTAVVFFLYSMVGCLPLVQAAEPPEVEVTGALPVELLGTTEKAFSLLFTTKSGTKVSISCEKLALEKALLEEAGKGSGTGSFTGCTTLLNGTLSTPCKPKVGGASLGTIKTLALKALLVTHEGASVVKVEAQSGKLLVKVEMGGECSIGEIVNVEAKSAGEGLWLKEKNGQLETLKATHGFEEGPLAGLIALGQPATLTGSESISLSGAHASREWRGLASKPAWFVGT